MSANNDFSIPPKILKALYKQELNLKNNPVSGINFHFNENDTTDIQADIEGPEATPYEGGIFRVVIKITPNFPNVAPKGIFLTKIFHPNISEQGEICVNTLKRDWDPNNWSLSNLFQVIKCLLIIPFPQSALNEEAAKLYMEEYDEFVKIAKMMTSVHAKLNKNKEDQKVKDDFSDDSDDNNKIKNDIKRQQSLNKYKIQVGIVKLNEYKVKLRQLKKLNSNIY
jgi:ubiquitin-conjugating enzyme E2 S